MLPVKAKGKKAAGAAESAWTEENVQSLLNSVGSIAQSLRRLRGAFHEGVMSEIFDELRLKTTMELFQAEEERREQPLATTPGNVGAAFNMREELLDWIDKASERRKTETAEAEREAEKEAEGESEGEEKEDEAEGSGAGKKTKQ